MELIAQLVSIVLGGGAVSMFWAWRNDQLAQYRQLDDAYSQLLEAYREQPELGDPAATVRYKKAFDDKARLRYHYFAMSVHNVLETLFDILDERPTDNHMWMSIFKHHARLHYAWLLDNTAAFEERYVEYVKSTLGPLPVTVEIPDVLHVADPVRLTGSEPPSVEQRT